jgi:hypothetical protein
MEDHRLDTSGCAIKGAEATALLSALLVDEPARRQLHVPEPQH